MPTQWIRDVHTGLSWSSSQQSIQVASVAAGKTIVRTRFQWGMHATTSSNVHVSGINSNFMLAGMVTTVGNGTETVPSPNGMRNDQDPPTQRWIWWEARVPEIVTLDVRNEVATWRVTPPVEPSDSKGMVLATGIPSGDTLNLWWTWQAYQNWDPTGQAQLWLMYNVLVDG